MKHLSAVAIAASAFIVPLDICAAPIPAGRVVPLPSIFGRGVKAVTVCMRPRDAGGGSEAYLCHGPHVTNFTRPGAGRYLLELDANYEPDELAVIVLGMGPLDSLASYPYGVWSSSGNPPAGDDSNGIVSVPTVWQTGPAGQKNQRVIQNVAIDLGTPNDMRVTFAGPHSDPFTVLLLFLDRTRADFRDPPLAP